jgi:hypothetical protein
MDGTRTTRARAVHASTTARTEDIVRRRPEQGGATVVQPITGVGGLKENRHAIIAGRTG